MLCSVLIELPVAGVHALHTEDRTSMCDGSSVYERAKFEDTDERDTCDYEDNLHGECNDNDSNLETKTVTEIWIAAS